MLILCYSYVNLSGGSLRRTPPQRENVQRTVTITQYQPRDDEHEEKEPLRARSISQETMNMKRKNRDEHAVSAKRR